MLALKLPKDIEDRLEVLAKRAGQSKVDFALRVFREQIEDLEDAQIAFERLANDDGMRIPLSDILADIEAQEAAAARTSPAA